MKDFLLQAGVVTTLILGLVNLYYNLRAAKRTAFINTVTSERVKWISKVRDNVSLLCSLCDQWMHHRTQENTPELQRQIERVKNEVRLQLNAKDPEDQDIERLLGRLPSLTSFDHRYGRRCVASPAAGNGRRAGQLPASSRRRSYDAGRRHRPRIRP